MELGFASKGLRQICERQAKARALLGVDAAAALQRRLADLEAVDALTELDWLPIVYRSDGTASIEFCAGHWLNVVANPGVPNVPDTPKTDWTAVDRIELIGID